MKKPLVTISSLVFLFLLASSSNASSLAYYQQGSPDYNWWYGCSPTSAGMMMGYYDRNGYNGLRYDNLVPGGTAESSTYGSGTLVNQIIASSGHITDFYSSDSNRGYDYVDDSGDDIASTRSFDSLADFMGTSQDSVNSANGSTWFYYNPDGSRLYASDVYDSGDWESDGMYGIGEYIAYAGYSTSSLFTQLTDNKNSNGFSFVDYMAEIDAGRVVMIHVQGHSMYGYGYDADTETVLLHDTWYEGEHSMTWGGSYSGRSMWGVTAFTLTGGTAVPVPPALLLFASGLLGFAGLRRKHNN